MTFEEYLQSDAAREEVRQILNYPQRSPRGPGWVKLKEGAWQRLEYRQRVENQGLDGKTSEMERAVCYVRQEGERFIVSDLGEGWRALRLRGYDWHQNDGALMQKLDDIAIPLMQGEPNYEIAAPWGTLELRQSTQEALPGAICRVLLASFRISKIEARPLPTSAPASSGQAS